jgi:hypothetical protein
MEIKIREDEKYFYAGGNIYVEAGNSTRERRFHDHFGTALLIKIMRIS